jgi:hypothetical protein
VVYGAWWWPAFAPVYFRPWFPRHVVVTHVNIVRAAPPIHWHPRPASTPVRSGGGQWAAQPPRPSPVRSFKPTSTQPPRAQFQAPRPQALPQSQMPAAHIRATPAPMQQHWSRGPASGGGWAASGGARSGGGGHVRGGGGHGGGRRG